MSKIIYITIPAQCKQGGVESLYQLSDGLLKAGFNCKVLYVVDGSYEIIKDGQPEKFSNYKAESSETIEDNKDNFLIVPEVWSQALNKFKNLKKCIWWLSVTNNLNSFKGRFEDWKNRDIIHFFESYFTQQYVTSRGGVGFSIRDYINPKNYKNLNLKRKNVACYNPQKTSSATFSAIEYLKNNNFDVLPLEGFTAEQLIKKFNECKIYFDFGHFPGRDRLPREAALNGCVVVTNMQGSAAFYEDLMIPPCYKQITFNGDIFKDIMQNFEKHSLQQQPYRKLLIEEEKTLVPSLKRIFGKELDYK